MKKKNVSKTTPASLTFPPLSSTITTIPKQGKVNQVHPLPPIQVLVPPVPDEHDNNVYHAVEEGPNNTQTIELQQHQPFIFVPETPPQAYKKKAKSSCF